MKSSSATSWRVEPKAVLSPFNLPNPYLLSGLLLDDPHPRAARPIMFHHVGKWPHEHHVVTLMIIQTVAPRVN
jgi:hypothetical protein